MPFPILSARPVAGFNAAVARGHRRSPGAWHRPRERQACCTPPRSAVRAGVR